MHSKGKAAKYLAAVLAFICFGIAIFSAGYVWTQCREYEKGDKVYSALAETATVQNKEDSGTTPGPLFSDSANGILDDIPNVDFAALQETNPEIIAWLYCPGTEINYPIVQGADNSYYLTHLADGTVNKNGCLFVDCLNAGDFSDDNTVIYGHNMKSGAMFACLLNYKDQEYFDEHPVMYLITPEHQYEIWLFAGYTTKVGSESYYLQFGDSCSLAEWIRDAAEKSDFKTSMQLTTNDRIVTLSTCAYDFLNARYVVHGKIIEI